MKNANSRFVRVLAVALVVLMVLPAALVGCGSNKANDAAISEALAAAQAAKDAADKAQQKAEAAQKELEEANKKAEQLEKELEALKTTKAPEDTTAPVTTPSVNKQEVIVYGIDAVDAIAKDLKAAGKIGKTAGLYAEADWQAIGKYFEMTEIAINKAATIDEITEIVEAFYAYVEAMPTYAERVYEAYKAIDFASDLDVVDVVYAYNYLTKTVLGNGLKGIEENKNAVIIYGEEELNLAALISTEYYRYTSIGNLAGNVYAVEGDIKPLYKEIYNAAVLADIDGKIDAKIDTDDGWKVESLKYFIDGNKTVKDVAEAIKESVEDWYDRYFKGEALEADYEAFRQAFIGEDVILDLNKDEDALWNIVLAVKERADALEVAREEYEDVLSDYLDLILDEEIVMAKDSDDNSVVVLADVNDKLAAFIAKHKLGNPANAEDKAVIASVLKDYKNNVDTYATYELQAAVISYFAALEKTAASLDAEAFAAADKQFNGTDLKNRFDFAKYGSAIKAIADWYVKFEKINPTTTAGYEKYSIIGDKYAVAKLIDLTDPTKTSSVINEIFVNIFEENHADFVNMNKNLKDAYDKLATKKGAADSINLSVDKFLKSVTKKDAAAVKALLGDITELSNFFAKSASKRDVAILGGNLKAFFEAGVIEYTDVNSDAMIDWADLEQLSDNFDAMKAEAKEAATEIMDLYVAVNGDVNADGDFVITDAMFNGGVEFIVKGAKKVVIDVYAYETIKALEAFANKVDVTADIFAFSDNLAFEYEPAKNIKANISYEKAYSIAGDLVGEFHMAMKAMQDDVYNVAVRLPVLARPTGTNVVTFWNDVTITAADLVAETMKTWAKSITNESTRKENVKTYISGVLTKLHSTDDYKVKGYYTKKSNEALEKQTSGYDFYNIGFLDAVLSVDPVPFFTIVYSISNGEESDHVDVDRSSFDSAGYIKALDAALDKNFAAFSKKFAAYAGDEAYKVSRTAYKNAIDKIVTVAFAYDLWEMTGVIDEKNYYSIEVATDNANSTTFELKTKKGEPVDKILVGNWGETDVYVKFAVARELIDEVADKASGTDYSFTEEIKPGVYYLEPTLVGADGSAIAENSNAMKAILAKYADKYAFLKGEIGFDVEEHTYDVRDAAAEIGANFAKFAGVKKIASNSTYRVATEAELKAIFAAEASAYENYQKAVCNRIVYKYKSGELVFGTYIEEAKGITDRDSEEGQRLLQITEKYKNQLSGKTLEEAKEIVENFKLEVDKYLAN